MVVLMAIPALLEPFARVELVAPVPVISALLATAANKYCQVSDRMTSCIE
jgi:hypothetical protein